MEQLSLKNNKTQLLQAYEDMKEEFEAFKKQATSPATQVAKKREEEVIVEKTRLLSSTNLEEDITILKRKTSMNLDELLEQLVAESIVLEDIRKAIEIEKKYLQETRNIKLADEALEILINEFEQKQIEFEKKKSEQEKIFFQEQEQKEKERGHEEEEFRYNQKISRRNEEDKYQAESNRKRGLLEKEWETKEQKLTQREEEIVQKEKELADLKLKVESLTREHAENIIQERELLTQRLEKESSIEMRLHKQQCESEKKMLEAKIENLQTHVLTQTEEIRSLKSALGEANNQAQTLAATVVENMSGIKQMKINDTSSM